MSDSVDLVVVGAYYGTGSNGRLMTSFLMAVYDAETQRWKTVCKVGSGHDDATIKKLQGELKMTKISKDFSKVPAWLHCTKPLTPDFITDDPKTSQVFLP